MLKKMFLVSVFLLPTFSYSHNYRDTAYETVERPRQQCWTESSSVRYRDNTAGVILGSIAGGILGNRVARGGHHHGRVAATAIGAATGAIVGDSLSRSSYPAYRNEQHCRTVMERVRVPVAAPQEVVYNEPVELRSSFYTEPEYSERVEYHHRHHRGCHHRDHQHYSGYDRDYRSRYYQAFDD
ncbi:MAG: hypothetical protein V4525_15390 [Pseudomonadota bacterium]